MSVARVVITPLGTVMPDQYLPAEPSAFSWTHRMREVDRPPPLAEASAEAGVRGAPVEASV